MLYNVAGFFCTKKWISYMYTYPLFFSFCFVSSVYTGPQSVPPPPTQLLLIHLHNSTCFLFFRNHSNPLMSLSLLELLWICSLFGINCHFNSIFVGRDGKYMMCSLCHLELAVSSQFKNILPRLLLFKNYFPYGHLKDFYFSNFTYDNELIVMKKTYFFP